MKPFALWLTMVFIISVYPFNNTGMRIEYADKLVHMVLYAITCALFWTAFRGRTGRWALPLAVLFATAYGLLMEIAQDITGRRTFSLMDGLANFTGAALAALFIWIRAVLRRKMQRG